MDLPDALTRHQSAIRAEMQTVLEGRNLPLYQMVRYHLGWIDAESRPREGASGKGLRPALCLIAAAACDPSAAAFGRALAGAAALEFIHNYSLVHDDIQDGDRDRHHQPTVWARWGVAQGINAGDALHALAWQALGRARAAGAPASAVLDGMAALNAAGLTMIEGQALDLAFEERTDVTPDAYHDMIARKTGAMIAVSLQLGALLAGADAALAQRLHAAGQSLGLLFQIRDDILGTWGDSAVTGKSSDNDIRRRKKSLPVVHAFTHADAESRARLGRIYQQPTLSDADVRAVLGILDACDARGAADAAVAAHHTAFLRALGAGLPLHPAGAADLRAIAAFLRERTH